MLVFVLLFIPTSTPWLTGMFCRLGGHCCPIITESREEMVFVVLVVFCLFFCFLFHNIKILGFLEKESASKSTFLLSINGHRKFPKNESHSWFPSKNKEDQVQQFGYFMKV